jgi:hypothetical protein
MNDRTAAAHPRFGSLLRRPLGGLDPTILLVGAPWLRHALRRPRGRRRRANPFRRTVSTALGTFLDGELAGWGVYGRLDGRSGTAIVAVGPDPDSGALLKVAAGPCGRVELERQTTVLAAMHADARLGSWRELLPRVLAAGEVDGTYCVLETRLPADDGRLELADPDRRERLVAAAVTAIGELNRRTATQVEVTDRELNRWVSEPVARVRAAVHGIDRRTLDRMERSLAARLAGRRVATGWTHGDYHPANVLTDRDGATVGIVDWCAAQPDGMVVLDVVSFLLFTDMSVRGQELGAVVRTWLGRGRSAELEWVHDAQTALDSDLIDVPTLILLAWLRHISHFIASEPPGALSPVWTHRNVRAVLRAWTATDEGDVPQ